MTTISPQDLSTLLVSNPALTLIDVRTPAEFREAHVQAARLVPLDQLEPQSFLAQRGGAADQPVYILCKSGGRAARAQQQFAAAGFSNAIVVEGGTSAWIAEGLPVERGGRKSISLERQVRITVGALNLTMAVLALTVDPLFAAGCAFFGAGLLFAGITDWCGMGLLLARCPWNR